MCYSDSHIVMRYLHKWGAKLGIHCVAVCLRYIWLSIDKNRLKLQQNCSPCRRTRTNIFPAYRKGYNKSKTTYEKLLARKTHICWVHLCVINCSPLFQNNFPNKVWTKMNLVESDLSCWILLCRDLSYLHKEFGLVCVRSIIKCWRVQMTTMYVVRNIIFFWEIIKKL